MSSTSVKRHNHKVHPCEASRKQELLKHLISFYEGKSILVLSKANTSTTQIEEKNLTLSNDAELVKMGERKWDVLISFDLPKSAEEYMKRLSHANTMALILVSAKEEALLYPIETILGKNLPRETVPGFEVKKSTVIKREPHRPTQSQKRSEEAEKEREKASQRNHRHDGTVRTESEKRNEGKPKFLKDSDKDRKEKKSFGKKEWDKPKGDKKPWENKSSSNDYRNKKESTHTSSKPKRAPRVIKIPTENKPKES